MRIGGAAPGRPVSFRFEGQPVAAYEGESVACALAAVRILRVAVEPVDVAGAGEWLARLLVNLPENAWAGDHCVG